MKILHVVPSYYPAVRYGGPIRSVHGLASAVARRGHEVHVYTTNVDGPNNSDVSLDKCVERDGVRVWYYPTELGRRLYRSPEMGHALRSHLNKFDIVHIHSVFLWPTFAAGRAARRSSIPYLVAPRGMLVRELIRKKSPLAKRAWIALFDRRNIECASAVHVTSEIEAHALEELDIRPRRVALLANGIEFPDISTDRVPAPSDATRDRPFILFLGRVNWTKGLDRLIPAMTDVREADLVVAGNDEENYKPTLIGLARKFGVSERVRFVGPVNGVAKWDLLRRAKMLVLPSYSENFGIVALEAMSVGRPVLVTPEVGLASTVREANAGLVIEGEPERLAAAINDLLQDPDKCQQMGEAGRRIAKERFSWDAIAQKMELVYEQCICETQNGV